MTQVHRTEGPLARRAAYALFALAFAYLISEAGAWGLYWLVFGDASPGGAQRLREAVARAPETRLDQAAGPLQAPLPGFKYQTLHPFVGFTLDPDAQLDPGDTLDPLLTRVNAYGFNGEAPPLGAQSPDGPLRVAVTGGSFAYSVASQARETLERELDAIPGLGGRGVAVYNLALPGMKQPQQLMALSFFLSLGFRPDVVINLDGFNEMVLPVTDNLPSGVFPFYPRGWQARVSGVHQFDEPELLRRAGGVLALERQRAARAELFSRAPWRWSPLANLVWRLLDRQMGAELEGERAWVSARRQALGRAPGTGRSFSSYGPELGYASDTAMYRELAAHWARASRLMHGIAKAEGLRYFHFLQPNQYLAGSKPFTAEEQAIALESTHPYRPAALAGYPHLIRAGQSLRHDGVSFFDLTMVFRENDDVLYADACCHLNTRGYSLIAEAIAECIRGELAGMAQDPSSAPVR